jgi:para-aminobenzoate synthetase/4-amino-4-deoxychorismate lyase
MTSTVSAEVSPSLSLADTLRALFPSGSVTGAPKRRTMEILRDLEGGPRGVYTGAIGLLRPDGRWTFNVAIRTLTLDVKTGRAVCPVGSGITWSSRPAAEYEECLLKSRFLSGLSLSRLRERVSRRDGRGEKATAAPLETILLENGRWFLLEDHLARLRSTAQRFGWPLDLAAVRDALRRVCSRYPRGSWKVRLTALEGAPAVTVSPVEAPPRPWRVALSRLPLDPADPFLYHKTTNREMYDSRRRARPEVDDVLLINTRGELTESTVANLVIERRGRFYTPPLSSGLLPGVFRGHLLKKGIIRERVLRKTDLTRADRIFLINSVRRWIPAQFLSG